MIPKVLKLFALGVLLAYAILGQPASQAQTWSNGYGYRRAVTIDHTKVPNSDQTNFPVLISGTYSYLATIPNGGDVTNPSGYDIIFTSDAAGNTVLPFETESYAASTGTVVVWIKVAALSHSIDTVIYMFYGNGAITTDQSNKAGVWDSNYVGVWHLPNGASLTAADSTSNANNGTITGVTATSGQIDGAASFSGTGHYIDVGNGTSLQVTGNSLTVEAWLNTSESNPSQYKRIVIKETPSNADPYAAYGLNRLANTNKITLGISRGGAGSNVGVTSASSVTMGAWTHIVGTYDGAHLQMYFNGTLDAQTATTGSIITTNQDVVIGADTAASTEYFTGSLDEVRISNVTRSADWIAAEYHNQSNPSTFYSVGSADTTGSGGATAPSIASLSPGSGPVTTLVTIYGTNFGATQGTSTVTFDGVAATPTVWTASAIVVAVPNSANTGDVVVTVGSASSNSSTFTVTTAPGIVSVSPNSAMMGASVTISGVNFGTTPGTVTLSGLNATITNWADTSITAIVPTGATSGPFSVTVGGQTGFSTNFVVVPFPPGWSDQDVGVVGLAGSGYYANSTFTVNGAGTSLWGTADSFHFVYQQLSGDGSIQARVLSVGANQTAGVELRETLNSNAKSAFMAYYNGGAYLNYRASTGGSTSQFSSTGKVLPYWVKLTRSGTTVTGYASQDGVNWQQVGSALTISMAQTVYFGLGVSSGSTSTLATGTLDNVSFTATANPGPTINSVSPTNIVVGGSLTINGVGFGATQGASQALLNGSALPVSEWSDSSITAAIPSGATSGYLQVVVSPSLDVSNLVRVSMLQAPLFDQDVGNVGPAGSATFSNGAFTLQGAGQWIGSTADSLHFVYQQLSGNATIVGHLASLQGNAAAAAGLMIRDSLNASAGTGSVVYTQGNVYLATRNGAGYGSVYASATPVALPRWLKLVRTGNVVYGYVSTDWINWTSLGYAYNGMGQNIYVGYGVSSGNTSTSATAVFDYISVSTPTTPAPTITTLSATTGPVGTQVTVTGNGFGQSQGSSLVLLNGAAVTVNTWSSTSISINIPTGATSGPLVVSVAPSMNDSNPMYFNVTSQPLPVGWLDQDVGQVGVVGNATFSNNTFTVQAAGSGINGSSGDQMHFVYQPLFGDGVIVARVVSVQGATGASAGVIIRATLDSGTATAYVGQSGTSVGFVTRAGGGYGTITQGTLANTSSPYWVKLVRTGNIFKAYAAADGVNWVQVGATGASIGMPQSVYVGLVSSGNSTTALGTSAFDDVSLSASTNPAPIITGLSATSGIPGTQVTIFGGGFGSSQGNSLALLNDAPMAVSSWSDGAITATIPTGAASGPLVVSVAPSMNDSNPAIFGVTSQPLASPWLDQDVGATGLAGSATYSGGTFTIQGAGVGLYSDTDAMHFVFQELSGDGQIVARLVSLQQSGTTASTGLMIRSDLSSNTGAAIAYDSQGVSHLGTRGGPGYGPATQSGPAITLPCWLKLVRSGSIYRAYESADGSTWTQIGGGATLSFPTNVYVGLEVSSGNSTSLATATFDNVSVTSFSQPLPIPQVTSVLPTYGAIGQSIAVYGSNFGNVQGTSAISFNGTQATSILDWSSGRIVALVPSGATSGPVVVSANSYQSNSTVLFAVINPIITSLTPPAAGVGGSVTVSGSGFGATQGTSTLQFNGATATIQAWSDTSITATVPAAASSGPVIVTVVGIEGIGPDFTLTGPVLVDSVTPDSGSPGATVTVTGSGFGPSQSNSSLTFNGVQPTSIVSWSDTEIQAIIPPDFATGPVYVNVAGVTGQGPTFTLTSGVTLIDSLGNQTNYASVSLGGAWQLRQVQGSGCSSCTARGNISYSYDSSGNALSRTDELGRATTYTYDSNGNVLTTTVPLTSTTSATSTYTYNSLGEVLTATDPMGNVTTNTYDAHGNLLTVTTPAPNGTTAASVTQFAYDPKGELTSITDPLNNVTTLSYTLAGLVATITDAQNNVTTYGYDSHGNRTSVTDALHHQTTFAYDAGDRLTTITYPDTTTTTFAYDYRGRRTSVTDQNGKTTTYTYDDADRLTSVTDAANNVTRYAYDTENNLTGITDANNNTTSFAYDEFGRVTQTTFPSSGVETYSYDAVGNLTGKTDRKNQAVVYAYDLANRLTQKTYPDSTSVDYTYDNDSRLTQVTDPTGTYQFTFDNMGRLVGTTTSYSFLTGRNFTTSYSYDKASNRTGFTDPESGSTTYAYDTLNRLSTLTPPSVFTAGSFGFTYDALSRRTQMTRPNGVTTNYTYDNLSRLLSVLHQLSGSTIDGAIYTLDDAGNRTTKTDQRTAVATTYGYDNIYQLLSATQGATTTESYAYDAVGNRTSSLGVSSYTTNSSNELTANSNASFTYDNNGNELSKVDSTGTTSYSWDFENRLTQVTLPGGGGTVQFSYDPFGRRIKKSSSAATGIYAYDGDNLIEETNSSGTSVARYSLGLNVDEPLAMLRSATTSYYHADGLGSVTSLSNGSGSLVQTYGYDTFGRQTSSSGSLTNAFQYTGREFDSETGLQFSRRRYFDSGVGRFLSEDPIRGISGELNFYAYVQNNSANLTDPTGLCPTNPTGEKAKCPGSPDPRLRLVPISDCVHRGSRRIVYELQGPDASCWWVTEHVDPPGWAPAAPAKHSPEGQTTGNENDGPGGFDDNLFGFDTGSSTQTFTASPEDPRVNPKTPSFPLIVQLPTGPDGKPQDFGTLAHFHNGLKSHCINGNCTGWVPCKHSFDVPGS